MAIFGNLIIITDSSRKLGNVLKRSDNKDNRVIKLLMFDESMQSDHVDRDVISNDTVTERKTT